MPGAPPTLGQPLPRRRRALLLLGGAATALAFLFTPTQSFAQAGSLSKVTFVGPVPRAAALAPRSRVALKAEEPKVVDAEVADGAAEKVEEVESVFDGPRKKTTRKRFNGKSYFINKVDWTYTVEKANGELGKEKGKWAPAWNMPEKDFKRREKQLRQRWRAKKRKLRIKHGMGQKWPNGKYIFLAKLQGSIFTRQKYGEKYVGRAEWHFSPNEIEARERQLRALQLKRRLEQEAEEKRVERLRELGVWPGEQSWRRPWQPKVDLTPPGLRKRL